MFADYTQIFLLLLNAECKEEFLKFYFIVSQAVFHPDEDVPVINYSMLSVLYSTRDIKWVSLVIIVYSAHFVSRGMWVEMKFGCLFLSFNIVDLFSHLIFPLFFSPNTLGCKVVLSEIAVYLCVVVWLNIYSCIIWCVKIAAFMICFVIKSKWNLLSSAFFVTEGVVNGTISMYL